MDNGDCCEHATVAACIRITHILIALLPAQATTLPRTLFSYLAHRHPCASQVLRQTVLAKLFYLPRHKECRCHAYGVVGAQGVRVMVELRVSERASVIQRPKSDLQH